MIKSKLTVEEVKKIGNIYGHANNGFESTYLTEYVKLSEFLSTKNLTSGFIEIGSAWGASFHLIASYVDGIKISVDIPFDQNVGFVPYPPNLNLNVMKKRQTLWESHFNDVHQIVGNSHNVETIQKVKDLVKTPVSLLYIDADHSRKAAELDFNNYKQFVEKGGYVAFHDIQLGHPYDLTGMWSELKQSYEYEELIGENECIGIIKL